MAPNAQVRRQHTVYVASRKCVKLVGITIFEDVDIKIGTRLLNSVCQIDYIKLFVKKEPK